MNTYFLHQTIIFRMRYVLKNSSTQSQAQQVRELAEKLLGSFYRKIGRVSLLLCPEIRSDESSRWSLEIQIVLWL